MKYVSEPPPAWYAFGILALGFLVISQLWCAAEEGDATLSAAPKGLPPGRWIIDTELVDTAVVVKEDGTAYTNSLVLAVSLNSSMGFLHSHWVAEERESVVVFLEAATSDVAAPSIKRRADGIYWLRLPVLLGRSVLLADGEKARKIEVRLDRTLTQVAPQRVLIPHDPFSVEDTGRRAQ